VSGVDLVQWISAQLDTDERIARAAPMEIDRSGHGDGVLTDVPARWVPSHHLVMRQAMTDDEEIRIVTDCAAFGGRSAAVHIAEWDPARVLREIAAKRQLLALHTPEWSIVEWAHDQNGKGEAQVCRSCGNRDIDSWLNWRRLGDGDLPEGVKPPYVVAPCQNLRLLALPYEDRPGYQEAWRP
jgi:uncharacterized protein DUF6221